MRNRHESPFNEREWACVRVQAPLGAIILARKLPTEPPYEARASGTVFNWISRRFALNNPRDSAAKRFRPRRGL
jgi:hypothetical protein